MGWNILSHGQMVEAFPLLQSIFMAWAADLSLRLNHSNLRLLAMLSELQSLLLDVVSLCLFSLEAGTP